MSSSTSTPTAKTMTFCFNLSLEDEKPIMTDYWTASLEKGAFIGIRGEGAEKIQLLVKSEDEYTSPVKKIRKSDDNFIVETENSIYIVSAVIEVKKIA
jgi:hypothetical protein